MSSLLTAVTRFYEGDKEASGNICFGDPNYGPLGNIHGFLYAENHSEDYVLNSSGKPLPFEITGFLSAGEQVRIRRDYNGGSSHAKMTVNTDVRITNGTLDFPLFPGQSSLQGELADQRVLIGLAVRSWSTSATV